MDNGQELKRVADVYRDQGYDVTVRPGPDRLPAFAKDFRVEIVGRRGSESVLVAVRKDRDEVAADNDMQRYAEVTAAQPGWRFDFAILEAENPKAREVRGARELTQDEIAQAVEQADKLNRIGFPRFGVVAAWAALEAAMRMRLRASGRPAGWASASRQMVKELYSAGHLTPDEFRQIETASQLRNQIVHGFAPQADEPEDSAGAMVRLLIEVAGRLADESQPMRQTA
jgi:uncharacterized protein YutE (UPF0331/DUF86 family)